MIAREEMKNTLAELARVFFAVISLSGLQISVFLLSL